jgi:hypothetical protein
VTQHAALETACVDGDSAAAWGAPRSFVRAPGGHRVELMEAPPRR